MVKPGGQLFLLEHVRVNKPLIGPAMDGLDPLVMRMMGAHINRRTAENVRKAGLEIGRIEELAPGGLVKLIVARAGKGSCALGKTGQAAQAQTTGGYTFKRRRQDDTNPRPIGR